MRTLLAAAGVVGVVLWFLLPYTLDREIVVERDALSSILPIRAFLARSLQEGAWPMWNPEPVLGKPFLPEWQTGLFYPPSLLFFLRPFSRGFNAFFVFHYAWTGLGAFLLARAAGTSRGAAVVGALAWTLGGPLLSLGHLLNHLMAVSWLPWVLWGWTAFERPRTRIVASTLFLAMALLTGSPEMALLIAGLLVLWAWTPEALLVPPLAALAASAQLVPVWAYLQETHRGAHGLTADGVFAYSTPVARLVELAWASAPSAAAFLPSLYLSPLVVALALVGAAFLRPLPRLAATLVLLVLLALAIGENGALLPGLYATLPGMDLLRYPEKLLVGVSALVACGAAWGASRLQERLPASVAAVAVASLVVLLAADLARVNRGLLFSLPPEEVLAPPPIAETIRESGERRYYSNTTGAPRAASARDAIARDRALLFAATGELYGLGNVNTPASLNLVSHERLHRELEHVLQPQALEALHALGTGWATSFSPLRGPSAARVPHADSAAQLYRLGDPPRRAFVAERVAIAPDEESAVRSFVRADRPQGLAILEGVGVADVGYQAPSTSRVEWVRSASDEIALDVSADGPALLVVNDSYAPGWGATVDTEPARLERVNGVVRGVWLGGGSHRVVMRYRPPGLPLGMALSLATLVGLLAFAQRDGQ